MAELLHEVNILPYAPGLDVNFKQLNIAWIAKYFTVEAHDIEQLDHPDEHIIKDGGRIFFAELNGEIVGTCALIKTGEHEFELAKMAVAEGLRGKQIGKKLGLAVINEAKKLGTQRLWLESNRILTTAINLYHKLGFIEVPITATPYARADIRMEMWL